MSIALLLVRESLKVLLNLEPHDARGGISEVIAKLLCIHVDEATVGGTANSSVLDDGTTMQEEAMERP